MSKLNSIALCTLAAILLIPHLPAQTTEGGIVGSIRDEKGSYIANAKVTVTSPSTGLQRQTTTADNGIYRVMALPTGTYEVKAEARICRIGSR